MRRLLVPLMLGLLALMAGGAQAQDMSGFSKQQRSEIIRFAANNSLFVLYHEMAHLLIDQLRLPVLGKEEDAADNVATWTLLNKRTAAADKARGSPRRSTVVTSIFARSSTLRRFRAETGSGSNSRRSGALCSKPWWVASASRVPAASHSRRVSVAA